MAKRASGPGRKTTRRTAREGRRTCGAMPTHFRLLEIEPGFRSRQARLENLTSHRRALPVDLGALPVLTIPVVVHVVYRTNAENISAAQIRSQISVLNRDFRATNPDKSRVPAPWKGLVSDARIQFRLATRDPQGATTTGITRTRTTLAEFDDDDAVKFRSRGGINAWNTRRFLNIWVCNLQPWLGYAQFPGGPAATDGVVVQHTCFGSSGTAAVPFDLGRTTTHEVGHWLNLRHIWADTEDCAGTDFVADTPNAEGPNYGKPTFPKVSCNNGPNGDMFVNYMDYVDDDAMIMFTAQQVVRMRTALESSRPEIVAR